MTKKQKILITGSSGTIGTRLFERLLEKNYDIIGFDKNPNIWHKKLNQLTIKGNLLDVNDIKKIPTNINLIIHLAANARVYDLVVNPDLALENIITTHNILEFARKNKIKNFIFSSSREMYGNKENIISKEEDVDITRCESPYTAGKVANESLIHAYQKCFGINYIIFRFSNVYGKYDQSDRFVPLMIEKMRQNKNVYIYGKDKLLDFTYIDDTLTGIIQGIKKFSNVKNDIFNIASGKAATLIYVAKLLKKELNSKSKIIIKTNRSGEVVKYIANISKANRILGYKPKYSIEKGVELSIDWYLKKLNQ